MIKDFKPIYHFLQNMPGIRNFSLTQRQKLGRRSEKHVADKLRAKGYTILCRNYESGAGEIDIIAFRKGTVAFVEVRSLTDGAGARPEESVDYGKQKKIISTARAYKARHMHGKASQVFFRFDVAAVRLNHKGRVRDMEYYEDAFRPV